MDIDNRKSDSNKIRAFLFDRNKFFRQGVGIALAQCPDIEIIGEADDNEASFELIKDTMPQVALLDVNPPGLSGIHLTRRIAQNLTGISSVVLTPRLDDDELVQAAIAGASAYLSKDAEVTHLTAAIKRVANGELLIVESLLSSPLAMERAVKRFQGLLLKGRSADSQDGPLTEREAQILTYVSSGYSNKRIAHALGISEQTVKNHMGSIMNKLDASDRTHAVVMAIQNGWISTLNKSETEQIDLD